LSRIALTGDNECGVGIEISHELPRVWQLYRQRFFRHLKVRTGFLKKSRFCSGFPSESKIPRTVIISSKVAKVHFSNDDVNSAKGQSAMELS
jgi:hypothetical protein